MRRLLLLAPVLALTLVGCGGSDSPSPAAGSSGVTIEDFAFAPGTVEVHVGDSLEVKNDDGATHTLTADDGSFDTGELESGASKELTLDAAGSFTYHCEIHSYMKGTVKVSK